MVLLSAGGGAAGVLKSNPAESGPAHRIISSRANCRPDGPSGRFRHSEKDFSRQFCHVYAARLDKTRGWLADRAARKWGDRAPVRTLAQLQESAGSKSIIIGTLFKHQELKPNILKEISEEFQIIPQQKATRFTSDSDCLILEDELQRIRLFGNIDVRSTVTGVVCAVIGSEDESGKFDVDDVCWAGWETVPISPTGRPPAENRYVVLLSGVDLCGNGASGGCRSAFALRLLVDWLNGLLGDPAEQRQLANVVRVIIAGNLIRGSPEGKEGKIVDTNIDNSSDILTAVQLADEILSDLSGCVYVDVMPGEFDPTNFTLPQQPIHRCMFPKASRYETLHCATNPHSVTLDGASVVGTSGQPVDDIARYADTDDALDILESSLRWRHIAPTAPDTLCSYPYREEDPFILDRRPDIYFAGNRDSFQTKLVQIDDGEGGADAGCTRLVCVPRFSTTQTCAVVDLSNLDCHPVKFNLDITDLQ